MPELSEQLSVGDPVAGGNRSLHIRTDRRVLWPHWFPPSVTPAAGWEGACLKEGQPAAAGTTPVILRDSSNNQWIYYAGSNGQVCHYTFANASGWSPGGCLGGETVLLPK